MRHAHHSAHVADEAHIESSGILQPTLSELNNHSAAANINFKNENPHLTRITAQAAAEELSAWNAPSTLSFLQASLMMLSETKFVLFNLACSDLRTPLQLQKFDFDTSQKNSNA